MMSKTLQSAKPIALAVALLPAGASAQSGAEYNSDYLSDVDYGIICPVGEVERVPADGTVLGYITERQASQSIELTTQTIPLLKGIGFGIRTTNISDTLLGSVQVTVSHPPFPGHGSTADTWFDTFTPDSVNFNFFTFEFPFEMQTGTWTFTAHRFDVPLYSVSFNVVDPKTVPNLTSLCKGPVLTS